MDESAFLIAPAPRPVLSTLEAASFTFSQSTFLLYLHLFPDLKEASSSQEKSALEERKIRGFSFRKKGERLQIRQVSESIFPIERCLPDARGSIRSSFFQLFQTNDIQSPGLAKRKKKVSRIEGGLLALSPPTNVIYSNFLPKFSSFI